MAAFGSYRPHRMGGVYLVDVADIGAAVAADSLLPDKALAARAAVDERHWTGQGKSPYVRGVTKCLAEIAPDADDFLSTWTM